MDRYYYVGPEGGGDDIVAWFALTISMIALGWTIWNELTGYRRRQADEYWYRNVFSPNCIDPVIELLNTHLAELQTVKYGAGFEDERRTYGEEFSKKKENILSRLWISSLFSESYYGVVSNRLDSIEDDMAERFGSWLIKPETVSARDLIALREGSIAGVIEILRAAANIKLNRFSPRTQLLRFPRIKRWFGLTDTGRVR